MKASRYSVHLKACALATLFAFLGSNAAWGEGLQPISIIAEGGPQIIIPEHVEIPKELGSVQEEYIAAAKAPFVIFIQDAHAILDAQANIQSLIGHLQENYGTALVALEGGKGAMDPTIFRAFPDEAVKKKVLRAYFERAELTGTEMAALFNRGEARYFGIEDWPLYQANYLAYLKASRNREKILKELGALKEKFDAKRKTVYSDALNVFHEKVSAFMEEKSRLLDVLKFLKGLSGTDEKIGEYPELSALFESIERDSSMDKESLDVSIRELSDTLRKDAGRSMKKEALMEYNGQYQGFVTGKTEPAAFLAFLVKTGEALGAPVELTPEMRELLGHADTLASIRGTKVFSELERLIGAVREELITKPEERRLEEEYGRIDLLNDLARLELTREKLEAYEKEAESCLSLLRDRTVMAPALEFYKYALTRDRVLQENLKKLMKDEGAGTAAVVLGGFHTLGFERGLKENGFSYAVVTPKIRSLRGADQYEEVMRGKLSYKDFIRTTFYDAFVRHSSLRLVSELSEPDFRKVLKLWRDRILRKLSEEGRISGAADYTRYIDLLAKVYVEKFGAKSLSNTSEKDILTRLREEFARMNEGIINRLRARFESELRGFMEGFRALAGKNEVTPENVQALLSRPAGARPETLQALRAILSRELKEADLAIFKTAFGEARTANAPGLAGQGIENVAPEVVRDTVGKFLEAKYAKVRLDEAQKSKVPDAVKAMERYFTDMELTRQGIPEEIKGETGEPTEQFAETAARNIETELGFATGEEDPDVVGAIALEAMREIRAGREEEVPKAETVPERTNSSASPGRGAERGAEGEGFENEGSPAGGTSEAADVFAASLGNRTRALSEDAEMRGTANTFKRELAEYVERDIWREMEGDLGNGLEVGQKLYERNPTLYEKGVAYFGGRDSGKLHLENFLGHLAKTPQNLLSFDEESLWKLEALRVEMRGNERWLVAIDGASSVEGKEEWAAFYDRIHRDIPPGERSISKDEEYPFVPEEVFPSQWTLLIPDTGERMSAERKAKMERMIVQTALRSPSRDEFITELGRKLGESRGVGKTTLWHSIRTKDVVLGEFIEEMSFVEGEKELADLYERIKSEVRISPEFDDFRKNGNVDAPGISSLILELADKAGEFQELIPAGTGIEASEVVRMAFRNWRSRDDFIEEYLSRVKDRITVYNANGSRSFVREHLAENDNPFPPTRTAVITVILNKDGSRSLEIETDLTIGSSSASRISKTGSTGVVHAPPISGVNTIPGNAGGFGITAPGINGNGEAEGTGVLNDFGAGESRDEIGFSRGKPGVGPGILGPGRATATDASSLNEIAGGAQGSGRTGMSGPVNAGKGGDVRVGLLESASDAILNDLLTGSSHLNLQDDRSSNLAGIIAQAFRAPDKLPEGLGVLFPEVKRDDVIAVRSGDLPSLEGLIKGVGKAEGDSLLIGPGELLAGGELELPLGIVWREGRGGLGGFFRKVWNRFGGRRFSKDASSLGQGIEIGNIHAPPAMPVDSEIESVQASSLGKVSSGGAGSRGAELTDKGILESEAAHDSLRFLTLGSVSRNEEQRIIGTLLYPGTAKIRRIGPNAAAEEKTLVREGEPADCFYILYRGELKVNGRGPAKDVHVATIFEGQVVGEMAYFREDKKRNATVEVVSDEAVLIEIPYSALDDVFVQRPHLRRLMEHLDTPREWIRREILNLSSREEKGSASDTPETEDMTADSDAERDPFLLGRDITAWMNKLIALVAETVAFEMNLDLRDYAVMTYGSLARGNELVYASDIDIRIVPRDVALKENAQKLDRAMGDLLDHVLGTFSVSGLDADGILKQMHPALYYLTPEEVLTREDPFIRQLWEAYKEGSDITRPAEIIRTPSIFPATLMDLNFIAGNATAFESFRRAVRERLFSDVSDPRGLTGRKILEQAFRQELAERVGECARSGADSGFLGEYNFKNLFIRMVHLLVWHERSRFFMSPISAETSPSRFLNALASQRLMDEQDEEAILAGFKFLLQLRNILHVMSLEKGEPDTQLLKLNDTLVGEIAARKGSTPEAFEARMREVMAQMIHAIGHYFETRVTPEEGDALFVRQIIDDSIRAEEAMRTGIPQALSPDPSVVSQGVKEASSLPQPLVGTALQAFEDASSLGKRGRKKKVDAPPAAVTAEPAAEAAEGAEGVDDLTRLFTEMANRTERLTPRERREQEGFLSRLFPKEIDFGASQLTRSDKVKFYEKLRESVEKHLTGGEWQALDSSDPYMVRGESLWDVLLKRGFFSHGPFRDFVREITGMRIDDFSTATARHIESRLMEIAREVIEEVEEHQLSVPSVRPSVLKKLEFLFARTSTKAVLKIAAAGAIDFLFNWLGVALALGFELLARHFSADTPGGGLLSPEFFKDVRSNFLGMTLGFLVGSFIKCKAHDFVKRRIRSPMEEKIAIGRDIFRNEIYESLMNAALKRMGADRAEYRRRSLALVRELKERLLQGAEREEKKKVVRDLGVLSQALSVAGAVLGDRLWAPRDREDTERKFLRIIADAAELVRMVPEITSEAVALFVLTQAVDDESIPDAVWTEMEALLTFRSVHGDRGAQRLLDLIYRSETAVKKKFKKEYVREKVKKLLPGQDLESLGADHSDIFAAQVLSRLTPEQKMEYRRRSLVHLRDLMLPEERDLTEQEKKDLLLVFFYQDYFSMRDYRRRVEQGKTADPAYAARTYRMAEEWERILRDMGEDGLAMKMRTEKALVLEAFAKSIAGEERDAIQAVTDIAGRGLERETDEERRLALGKVIFDEENMKKALEAYRKSRKREIGMAGKHAPLAESLRKSVESEVWSVFQGAAEKLERAPALQAQPIRLTLLLTEQPASEAKVPISAQDRAMFFSSFAMDFGGVHCREFFEPERSQVRILFVEKLLESIVRHAKGNEWSAVDSSEAYMLPGQSLMEALEQRAYFTSKEFDKFIAGLTGLGIDTAEGLPPREDLWARAVRNNVITAAGKVLREVERGELEGEGEDWLHYHDRMRMRGRRSATISLEMVEAEIREGAESVVEDFILPWMMGAFARTSEYLCIAPLVGVYVEGFLGKHIMPRIEDVIDDHLNSHRKEIYGNVMEIDWEKLDEDKNDYKKRAARLVKRFGMEERPILREAFAIVLRASGERRWYPRDAASRWKFQRIMDQAEVLAEKEGVDADVLALFILTQVVDDRSISSRFWQRELKRLERRARRGDASAKRNQGWLRQAQGTVVRRFKDVFMADKLAPLANLGLENSELFKAGVLRAIGPEEKQGYREAFMRHLRGILSGRGKSGFSVEEDKALALAYFYQDLFSLEEYEKKTSQGVELDPLYGARVAFMQKQWSALLMEQSARALLQEIPRGDLAKIGVTVPGVSPATAIAPRAPPAPVAAPIEEGASLGKKIILAAMGVGVAATLLLIVHFSRPRSTFHSTPAAPALVLPPHPAESPSGTEILRRAVNDVREFSKKIPRMKKMYKKVIAEYREGLLKIEISEEANVAEFRHERRANGTETRAIIIPSAKIREEDGVSRSLAHESVHAYFDLLRSGVIEKPASPEDLDVQPGAEEEALAIQGAYGIFEGTLMLIDFDMDGNGNLRPRTVVEIRSLGEKGLYDVKASRYGQALSWDELIQFLDVMRSRKHMNSNKARETLKDVVKNMRFGRQEISAHSLGDQEKLMAMIDRVPGTEAASLGGKFAEALGEFDIFEKFEGLQAEGEALPFSAEELSEALSKFGVWVMDQNLDGEACTQLVKDFRERFFKKFDRPGVRRMVLTGGPGAGKSWTGEAIQKEFGDEIVFVPETARLILDGMNKEKEEKGVERAFNMDKFATAIYIIQRFQEEYYALANPGKVLICDRGMCDNAAYYAMHYGSEDRNIYYAAMDTTEEAELNRYEEVIHLQSPAVNKKEDYVNDGVRQESPETAAEIDGNISRAWSAHPRKMIIEHTRETTFAGKQQNTLERLRRLLDPGEIKRRKLREAQRAGADPVLIERIDRMKRELKEVFEYLQGVVSAVTVFGSARISTEDGEYTMAVELGKALYRAGLMVRTGAGPSMMAGPLEGWREERERSGNGMKITLTSENGDVVIVENTTQGIRIILPFEQETTPFVENYINVKYYLPRKLGLWKKSVCVVGLPGGFGTLNELLEVLTQGMAVALLETEQESFWGVLLDAWREVLLERDEDGNNPYIDANEARLEMLSKLLLTSNVDAAVQYAKDKGNIGWEPKEFSAEELEQMSEELEDSLLELNELAPSVVVIGKPREGSREVGALRTVVSELVKDGGHIRVASRGTVCDTVNEAAAGNEANVHAVIFESLDEGITEEEHAALPEKTIVSRFGPNHSVLIGEKAEAFVFVPGGIGTLTKLFAIINAMQTGEIEKVPVILIGGGFWKRLINAVINAMLNHSPCLIKPDDASLFSFSDSPEEALGIIGDFRRFRKVRKEILAEDRPLAQVEKELRALYPDAKISLSAEGFYAEREKVGRDANGFFQAVYAFLRSHPDLAKEKRRFVVLDTNFREKTLEGANAVNPEADETVRNGVYEKLSEEEKDLLFEALASRVAEDGGVIHLDHHYDLPVLSQTSTTVLVVDFLRYLRRQGEAGKKLIREIQGSFRVVDHADADVLLSYFAVQKANEEGFLDRNGDFLRDAAILNDHQIVRGDASHRARAAVLCDIAIALQLEVENPGSEVTFASAIQRLGRALDFAKRHGGSEKMKEIPAGERSGPEAALAWVRSFPVDDRGSAELFLAGVADYDRDRAIIEEMLARQGGIITDEIAPGRISRVGDTLFIYVSDDVAKDMGNASVLRYFQSERPDLLRGAAVAVTSVPALSSRTNPMERFFKVRSFFLGPDDRFVTLSQGFWNKIIAAGFPEAGGRAMAGGLSKGPMVCTDIPGVAKMVARAVADEAGSQGLDLHVTERGKPAAGDERGASLGKNVPWGKDEKEDDGKNEQMETPPESALLDSSPLTLPARRLVAALQARGAIDDDDILLLRILLQDSVDIWNETALARYLSLLDLHRRDAIETEIFSLVNEFLSVPGITNVVRRIILGDPARAGTTHSAIAELMHARYLRSQGYTIMLLSTPDEHTEWDVLVFRQGKLYLIEAKSYHSEYEGFEREKAAMGHIKSWVRSAITEKQFKRFGAPLRIPSAGVISLAGVGEDAEPGIIFTVDDHLLRLIASARKGDVNEAVKAKAEAMVRGIIDWRARNADIENFTYQVRFAPSVRQYVRDVGNVPKNETIDDALDLIEKENDQIRVRLFGENSDRAMVRRFLEYFRYEEEEARSVIDRFGMEWVENTLDGINQDLNPRAPAAKKIPDTEKQSRFGELYREAYRREMERRRVEKDPGNTQEGESLGRSSYSEKVPNITPFAQKFITVLREKGTLGENDIGWLKTLLSSAGQVWDHRSIARYLELYLAAPGCEVLQAIDDFIAIPGLADIVARIDAGARSEALLQETRAAIAQLLHAKSLENEGLWVRQFLGNSKSGGKFWDMLLLDARGSISVAKSGTIGPETGDNAVIVDRLCGRLFQNSAYLTMKEIGFSHGMVIFTVEDDILKHFENPGEAEAAIRENFDRQLWTSEGVKMQYELRFAPSAGRESEEIRKAYEERKAPLSAVRLAMREVYSEVRAMRDWVKPKIGVDGHLAELFAEFFDYDKAGIGKVLNRFGSDEMHRVLVERIGPKILHLGGNKMERVKAFDAEMDQVMKERYMKPAPESPGENVSEETKPEDEKGASLGTPTGPIGSDELARIYGAAAYQEWIRRGWVTQGDITSAIEAKANEFIQEAEASGRDGLGAERSEIEEAESLILQMIDRPESAEEGYKIAEDGDAQQSISLRQLNSASEFLAKTLCGTKKLEGKIPVFIARDAGLLYFVSDVLSRAPAGMQNRGLVYYLSRASLGRVWQVTKRFIDGATQIGNEFNDAAYFEWFKSMYEGNVPRHPKLGTENESLGNVKYLEERTAEFQEAVRRTRAELIAMGITGGTPVLLVDTGWSGSMPLFIQGVMRMFPEDFGRAENNERVLLASDLQPTFEGDPDLEAETLETIEFGFHQDFFFDEADGEIKTSPAADRLKAYFEKLLLLKAALKVLAERSGTASGTNPEVPAAMPEKKDGQSLGKNAPDVRSIQLNFDFPLWTDLSETKNFAVQGVTPGDEYVSVSSDSGHTVYVARQLAPFVDSDVLQEFIPLVDVVGMDTTGDPEVRSITSLSGSSIFVGRVIPWNADTDLAEKMIVSAVDVDQATDIFIQAVRQNIRSVVERFGGQILSIELLNFALLAPEGRQYWAYREFMEGVNARGEKLHDLVKAGSKVKLDWALLATDSTGKECYFEVDKIIDFVFDEVDESGESRGMREMGFQQKESAYQEVVFDEEVVSTRAELSRSQWGGINSERSKRSYIGEIEANALKCLHQGDFLKLAKRLFSVFMVQGKAELAEEVTGLLRSEPSRIYSEVIGRVWVICRILSEWNHLSVKREVLLRQMDELARSARAEQAIVKGMQDFAEVLETQAGEIRAGNLSALEQFPAQIQEAVDVVYDDINRYSREWLSEHPSILKGLGSSDEWKGLAGIVKDSASLGKTAQTAMHPTLRGLVEESGILAVAKNAGFDGRTDTVENFIEDLEAYGAKIVVAGENIRENPEMAGRGIALGLDNWENMCFAVRAGLEWWRDVYVEFGIDQEGDNTGRFMNRVMQEPEERRRRFVMSVPKQAGAYPGTITTKELECLLSSPEKLSNTVLVFGIYDYPFVSPLKLKPFDVESVRPGISGESVVLRDEGHVTAAENQILLAANASEDVVVTLYDPEKRLRGLLNLSNPPLNEEDLRFTKEGIENFILQAGGISEACKIKVLIGRTVGSRALLLLHFAEQVLGVLRDKVPEEGNMEVCAIDLETEPGKPQRPAATVGIDAEGKIIATFLPAKLIGGDISRKRDEIAENEAGSLGTVNALQILLGMSEDEMKEVSKRAVEIYKAEGSIEAVKEFFVDLAKKNLEDLRREITAHQEDFLSRLSAKEAVSFHEKVLNAAIAAFQGSDDFRKEFEDMFGGLVPPAELDALKLDFGGAVMNVLLGGTEGLSATEQAAGIMPGEIEAYERLAETARKKLEADAKANEIQLSLAVQYPSGSPGDMQVELQSLSDYSHILKILVILHGRGDALKRGDLLKIGVPTVPVPFDVRNPEKGIGNARSRMGTVRGEAVMTFSETQLQLPADLDQLLISVMADIRELPDRLKKPAFDTVLLLLCALSMKAQMKEDLSRYRSREGLAALLHEYNADFMAPTFVVENERITLGIREFIEAMFKAKATEEQIRKAA